MAARKFIVLAAVARVVAAESFPVPHWPWPTHTTETSTTTAPQPASRAFAGGFADGLGIAEDRSCFTDTTGSVNDLEAAVKEYLKGDWIDKAKAFAKVGEAVKEIVLALGTCSKSIDANLKYAKLLKMLENPRYYSMHNAVVLSLQAAEDHKQLADLKSAWEKGHFHEAGFQMATVLLDVLEHPGLPDRNGTAALDFAAGVAKGFSGAVDNGCFKGVSVEIGAVAGGVSDIITVVEIPQGLASLFQGLTGLVPLYRECMDDKKEIMSLLDEMKDLKHPAELAREVAHNVAVSGIDISMEAASAFLDFKGQSWERFGEDVGKILSKLFVPSSASNSAATIVV